MKKLGKVLLTVVLTLSMCLGLCACGGSSDSDGNASGDGKVEITWWSYYAQSNMEYINVMINNFNSSQDKYHVTMVNQGGAAEIRTKLLSTKTENLPSMFTGTPITTGYYANSKFVAPMQQFLDADTDTWHEGIYDVVRTSYSDLDGNMVGWPFGVSSAGWFINTDLLTQAGYSIDQITNFETMSQAATAIVNKGLAKYGMAFGTNGVDLFDMLTLQGVDMVDADNGYSGDASRCVFAEGETATALNKALDIFGGLYKDKVALTYGSDTNSESIPLFVKGELAMFYATNSYANKVVTYNPTFNYTFIPSVPVDASATYLGNAMSEGTGSYICNTGDEAEMQGAYEFIKFLAKPENQAYWATCTGYIPYTEEGYNQADYQTWMTTNFPAAANVKNILLNSAAELRGPYTIIPNALQSACTEIYYAVSLDPTGDKAAIVQEAIDVVDEAFEIQALRNKK